MSPAEIWTKAIDMTMAQPAGPDALRDLADAFDRERDGEIVRAELAKARDREARCVKCGGPCTSDRWVYAHPTCHACLPPPEPLPVAAAWFPSKLCRGGCGRLINGKAGTVCGECAAVEPL